VSEDTCGGGGYPITSSTPFSEFPCRQTIFPFLHFKAVRPDWYQKDTDGNGGGPISSPI